MTKKQIAKQLNLPLSFVKEVASNPTQAESHPIIQRILALIKCRSKSKSTDATSTKNKRKS